MTSSKFEYSTIPSNSKIVFVITFVKCGKMAVGVTWNTLKTCHEIITGAPNDDRAYNNALKELKCYYNKKTMLYSIIHKAQSKKPKHKGYISAWSRLFKSKWNRFNVVFDWATNLSNPVHARQYHPWHSSQATQSVSSSSLPHSWPL